MGERRSSTLVTKPASGKPSGGLDSAGHQLIQNLLLVQDNYSSSCVMRWFLKATQKKFPIMR